MTVDQFLRNNDTSSSDGESKHVVAKTEVKKFEEISDGTDSDLERAEVIQVKMKLPFTEKEISRPNKNRLRIVPPSKIVDMAS